MTFCVPWSVGCETRAHHSCKRAAVHCSSTRLGSRFESLVQLTGLSADSDAVSRVTRVHIGTSRFYSGM